MPNVDSIPGRMLTKYFSEYINQFGLNSSWMFYAPDPPPSLYVEYEVIREGNVSEDQVFRWPDAQVGEILQERYNRRIASARMITSVPSMMKQIFIPWLCRKHQNAESIYVRQLMKFIPSIENARTKVGDFEGMSQEAQAIGRRYDCATLAEEQ
jgi:hypothetical protein